MNKKFVINDLGVFSVYDILVDIGYPVVFICKDEFSTLYLFYEFDYNAAFTEWVLIKISIEQYRELKNGGKPLEMTFKESLEKKWFVFKEVYDEQKLIIYTKFPEHLFLYKGIYLNEKRANCENREFMTAKEKLFNIGFEQVAKHKYVLDHKGSSWDYDKPFKIIVEFAFNSYRVSIEGENWVGVNLELSKVLTEYLEELHQEDFKKEK